VRSIDAVIADISARYHDDPQARDAAIAAAVDNWQAGEMFRTTKEAG
jgi:hypothetical protein